MRRGLNSLRSSDVAGLTALFTSDALEAARGSSRPPAGPLPLKREALLEVDGKQPGSPFNLPSNHSPQTNPFRQSRLFEKQ
jgi:hypothetical protein